MCFESIWRPVINYVKDSDLADDQAIEQRRSRTGIIYLV